MSWSVGLGCGNDYIILGVHGYRGDDFGGLVDGGGGYSVRGGSGENTWVSGGWNDFRDWLNCEVFRDDYREPWLDLVRKFDAEEAWRLLLHQSDAA